MATPIVIEIIGAPLACSTGLSEPWRQVAGWTAQQLRRRCGAAVLVRYLDLFEADCPPLPPDAQLPLVRVGGVVLSSGGKVSVPAIRQRLQDLGLEASSSRDGPPTARAPEEAWPGADK